MALNPISPIPMASGQTPASPPEDAAQGANCKLTASHINSYYGSFHALHDVSLHVHVNQITALIGPSGLREIHIPESGAESY